MAVRRSMVLPALVGLLGALTPNPTAVHLPTAAAATVPAPIVVAFGDAPTPSEPPMPMGDRVVGIAAASNGGYWLAAQNGEVQELDGAPPLGSAGNVRLHQPVIAIQATPTGHGFWLAARDGGVFAFGDAGFAGSMGGEHLNQPIVGMASTPSGRGYWLVASDGGVFTFGDAPFLGSTGGTPLNRPVVSMAATPDGRGYWLAAADGGVFTFGDAAFAGSAADAVLARPVVAVSPSSRGGYWLLGADGHVFPFGEARVLGSAEAERSGRSARALLPTPTGEGYRLLTVPVEQHLAFGGDVHAVGRAAAGLASGNPLAPISAFLNGADVAAVNLETAVGSAGAPQTKQYVFRSPVTLLDALAGAGVDVVSLANNHALDYGRAGLLETMDLARARGLRVVGAGRDAEAAYAPAVMDTPGGSVAFVGLSQVVPVGWAATASTPGVASAYDTTAMLGAVRRARQQADTVVVMIHWGVERAPCPTARQRSTAAELVRAGATLVVGSHPHVLQGTASLPGGTVAYSLGNFVWYTPGRTALLTAALTVDGASLAFVPAVIDGLGRPLPVGGPKAPPAAC